MKIVNLLFLSFINFIFATNIFNKKTSIIKKNKINSDQNFIPFIITYKIIDSKKINKTTLKKIRSQLVDILNIFRALIYTNIPKKNINLNTTVLKNFKIRSKELTFEEEEHKKHLLLLIKFKKLSNEKICTHELYKPRKKDTDAKVSKRMCSIALLNINSKINFDNLKFDTIFKLSIIKHIFKIIGFRSLFLKKKYARNNFNEIPFYLIENMKSFNSYQKYLSFNNKKYNKVGYVENGNFYISSWPNTYEIHDIMSDNIYIDTTITELTANLFNDLKIYSFNKCDLFKYEAGFGRGYSCHRPDMKCIDEEELNKNYFLEYTLFDAGSSKIICYLNTKINILNKQCGIKYGRLRNFKDTLRFCPVYLSIKETPKSNILPIPEINLYNSIKLKLVKKSKKCPSFFPRTILFSVPNKIFDEFNQTTDINKIIKDIENINKDVEYDEVFIKNKLFFPTYEATEENYGVNSVTSVFNNSGIIRSYSNLNSHNILLRHPAKSTFEKMHPLPFFQKLNSYGNSDLMSSKDLTLKQYNKMHKKFPEDYNYLAETYLYPENKNILSKMFKNYTPTEDNLWLIKPKSGSLGIGISIFINLKSAPDDYLITKYISHPHLIYNKKYDFRVYVLITGIAPLKIYLYKEGLVRFASEEYNLDIEHLKENYRHLTNISLNKKNKSFFKTANDVDNEEGNRWSLKAYFEYCQKHNIDYNYIRDQIKDIVIKEVLTVHKDFYEKIKGIKGIKPRNFFHLYGFDFLPDKNMKLYFLEGNDRPSLYMSDINDRKLKPQLVADIMNIVGIVPFSHDYKDGYVPYDNYNKKEFPYYKNEEERIKIEVEESFCEFDRPRGRFELIFPLKNNIEKYRKFFEVGLKENELLWKSILKE